MGVVCLLSVTGFGGRLMVHAPSLASSLAVSKSIAVNGCCLTITALEDERFFADLSAETVSKTTFGAKGGELKKGARLNLEQPLTAGKEFGGHFVLGHVDTIGRVAHLTPEGDNWWFGVQVPAEFARYVVPKGSRTIDGVSLTVARWENSANPNSGQFTVEVAVIPYTYENTNMRDRKPGDAVNLEGDVLGKYVECYLRAGRTPARADSQLTVARLAEEGF